MIVTGASGRRYFAPAQTPITWVEQAPAVIGSAIVASDLERDLASAVIFHRRPPLFQGVATAATSIGNSSWTPIPLGEIIDNYGGHADDANPSRVSGDPTDLRDDWYLCTGYVPIGGLSAAQVCIAGLRDSGGTVYEGAKLPGGPGHANDNLVVDLIRLSDASEYVELMAWQNSGAAQNTVVAGKAPSLTVRWACSASGDVVALPSMPRTWTAADILTADSTGTNKVPLNLHWRDVLRWLRYPPTARLHTTGTTQTIPAGTWTSINFNAESLDNYSGHSTSTNTSRYTCQRAGLYYVYGLAAVAEPASSAGYRASRLLVNGTTAYAGTSCPPATTSTAGTALPAVAQLRLAVGDYVELQMIQTQGTALSVKDGTGDSSKLIALWKSF